ncbi:TRAP transporter large permease subunit [Variovorax sp. J31P179]|uniref:TRAP transporter large permease n=1 Tax=Variovorax sp. J31P179 TaxID=3053508 RepID=UPI0025761654|nr:TRAP transporter large permease subunit [Variovorax sp. J31P179]MDM0079311.1 TRAP transporter large permease subunit [Variovorax sp. J31P179]
MNTTLKDAGPAADKEPIRSNAFARIGQRCESAIQWGTEILAVCLVVVEVFLLLTNVFFRYAMHAPLVWGDELASLLFIWLAMIGAVIALQRAEHMRLTTFVARMSPDARALCNTLSNVIIAAFVLLLIGPAWEYAQEEWAITTPALELPNTFRVMSIVVGAVLMLAIAVLRLMERAAPRDLLKSLAIVGGLAVVLYVARPLLATLGTINLILFLVIGVATLVAIGVPIMVAFGLSTLAYLGSATDAPLLIVVSRMDEGMSGIILLAVPLFVLLGALIEAMGMARAMIRFLASLIGHVRGGLSYVLVGAIYLVSGISGSKVADMAAVAPALFPEMKKRGEDEGELVSMLAASGAMSETIPPSLVLITIGSVTGVSIAALFTGGFMPAVVGALAMAAVIFLKSRRQSLDGVRRATAAEIVKAFAFALPAVILPFVIRAAVVEGVATATEVSAIGVAYTFVVGTLVYREFDWKRLYPILVETASLSGAILIIIGCATAMAWALTQSGFSAHVAHLMTALGGGKTGFLIVSAIAFILLGSFLEGIPAIVLFGPLLFPVARAMGVHEVHYAMVVIFSMGLGLFAPPIGVGYYAACAIGKVDPDRAMKRIWPYLAALVAALAVIAAFPWLSIGFL